MKMHDKVSQSLLRLYSKHGATACRLADREVGNLSLCQPYALNSWYRPHLRREVNKYPSDEGMNALQEAHPTRGSFIALVAQAVLSLPPLPLKPRKFQKLCISDVPNAPIAIGSFGLCLFSSHCLFISLNQISFSFYSIPLQGGSS